MGFLLLTGASSGVGRELAISLSKEHTIILSGRNEKRLQEVRLLCDNNPFIWNHELNDFDNLENDLKIFLKVNNISVDYFVHCAGVMKILPLRNIKINDLQKIFAVNVYAPAIITKCLCSKKINNGNLKSVVFISSNISNRGAAAFSMYSSSKAALDGLMRSLAVELAPGVRVNSVLPGGMITEMTKELFENPEMLQKFENDYPLGIGKPSDIAPIVEFLLSDKARWITGQQITIDGGRTIDITER